MPKAPILREHPASSPPPTVSAFEQLIAPHSLRTFFEQYWERRYLHVTHGRPETFHSAFSFADLDRCLHTAKDTDRRVVSIVPPPGSSRSQTELRGIDISLKQLYQRFHSGDTLVINSAQRLWPPLSSITAALTEALGAVASINVYLTPQGSQGFDVHIDTHDVFVIQVEGSKEWYLYESYSEAPTEVRDARHYIRHVPRPRPADGETLVETLRLQQGDVLYVPRGVPHKAVATDEPSLHLSVGIHPLYWVDLLKAAVEAAALSMPRLRHGLPPGFISDPEIREQMQATFTTLMGEVAGASAETFAPALDAMLSYSMGWQAFPPDGHFSQLVQLQQVGPESWVRRRQGIDCQLVNSGGTVGLAFTDNEMRGPLAIGEALRFIRTQRQFQVAQLPGLDDQSKVVLIRRLIREGLLQVDHEAVTARAD